MQGLKDHEIARILNAQRKALLEYIPNLPQFTRTLLSSAMMKELEAMGRRIDKKD